MGLLLLTLIISSLALHASLLIGMQLQDPIKKHFLMNRNILYYIIFFIKYLWMSLILSTAIES